MPPNSPTPDWGTLGPGSDIKLPSRTEVRLSPQPTSQSPLPQIAARVKRVLTAMLLVTIAMLFLGQYLFFRAERAVQQRPLADSQSRIGHSAPKFDTPEQRQAELLLRQAIAHNGTATAQIEANAPAWRGHIALTKPLSSMITAGLNAHDLHVRSATVQLDLAAMNINEDVASVDRLEREATSNDHATRVWAIWTLGLVANRGVERDRITDLLISHLGDSDVDSRHWAVEALSYVGTDAAIPPLLRTLHDDPSPTIRERAACALAESGMLTNSQRRTAIPTLLVYAEDSSLDAQTHAWTYHALRDITAQNLPDDAAAWRNWYENNR